MLATAAPSVFRGDNATAAPALAPAASPRVPPAGHLSATSVRQRRPLPMRPPPSFDDDSASTSAVSPVAAVPVPPAVSEPRAAASTTHAKRKQPQAATVALSASTPSQPPPESAAAAAPPLLPPAKRQKRPSVQLYNLRGTVTAVSPLIQRDASEFFFVELCELPSPSPAASCSAASSLVPVPLCCVILFTGPGALRWHPVLRVGQEVVITRLRTSVIFKDRPDGEGGGAKTVFVTTAAPTQTPATGTATAPASQVAAPFDAKAKQTMVLALDDDGIATTLPPWTPFASLLLDPSSSVPSPSLQPPSLTSTSARPGARPRPPHCRFSPLSTLSYTGTITSQLTWGVYELDGPTPHKSNSAAASSESATAAAAAAASSKNDSDKMDTPSSPSPPLKLFVHPLSFSSPRGIASMNSLRVGAQVRLHHVHLLRRAGGGGGRSTPIGFLCCLYSSIEVVESSSSVPPAAATGKGLPPFDSVRGGWYAELWTRLPLVDVALLLHEFIEWRRGKFVGKMVGSRAMLALPPSLPAAKDDAAAAAATAVSGAASSSHSSGGGGVGPGGPGLLLRLMSPSLASRGAPLDSSALRAASTDMYEQFFEHSSCSLGKAVELASRVPSSSFSSAAAAAAAAASSSSGSSPQPLPHFIPLADFLRLPAVHEMRESLLAALMPRSSPSSMIPSSAISASSEWSYRTLHSEQLRVRHPEVQLVGVLQSVTSPSLFSGASASSSPWPASPAPSSPLLRCGIQLVDRSCPSGEGVNCCVLLGGGTLTPEHHLGAMVLVRRFVVVMEPSALHIDATISANQPPTAAAAAVHTVLLFHIDDIEVLHRAAPAAAVAAPSLPPPASSSAAASATAAATSLVILHKSDRITRPHVQLGSNKSSRSVQGKLVPPPLSAISQTKLSPGSFNHTLHTVCEVRLIDEAGGGASASSTSSTTTTATGTTTTRQLVLEGPAQTIYPFLPIGKLVRIEGIVHGQGTGTGPGAGKGSAAPALAPPSSLFLRTAVSASTVRVVPDLPLPAPLPAVLHVRDVLRCNSLPRTIPYRGGPGAEIDRVSFRGLVLEKGFRSSGPPPASSQTANSSTAVSTSAPPATNVQGWWLLVRDVEYAHTLNVHVDLHARLWPGALLPGSVVLVRRGRRMLSPACHLYVECCGEGDTSCIEVERSMHLQDACVFEAEADADEERDHRGQAEGQDRGRVASRTNASKRTLAEEVAVPGHARSERALLALRVALHTHYPLRSLPLSYISSLSPFATPGVSSLTLSLRVRVSLLKSLKLQWHCSGCHRMLARGALRCQPRASSTVGGGILRACVAEPYCHAEAYVVVDDGTGMAILYVAGLGLICDALQLSPQERRQLRDLSLQMGCFEFIRTSSGASAGDESEAEWGESSSTSVRGVDELRLRCIQSDMWQRRMRGSFAGVPLQLCATQFYMRNVLSGTSGRGVPQVRPAATAPAAAMTSGGVGTTTGASSAASAPPSGGMSCYPFEQCRTLPVQIDSLRLDTLQAPPLTLRAVSIQASSVRQQAQHLMHLLTQQG